MSDEDSATQSRGAESRHRRSLSQVRSDQQADRNAVARRTEAPVLLPFVRRAAPLRSGARRGHFGFHRFGIEAGHPAGTSTDRQTWRSMGERVASHPRIGRLGGILEKPRYQAPRAIHQNSLRERKWKAPQGGTAMARRLALMAVVAFLLTPLSSVRAQFGGGTQIVFDPSMFARQLQQLQQETQTVLTEAQQLQYMIRNTTGGYAGVWQSSQSMLDELGGIIQQQGGLSYTLSNLQSQFQQQFPGYTVPSESGPTGSQKHRHHVEHPQRHSGGSPIASAKFCQRAGAIWRARRYEQDRCWEICRQSRWETKSPCSRCSRFRC